MNTIDLLFKHLTVRLEQLASFGFVLEDGAYCYRTALLDGAFAMQVTILARDGSVSALVTDNDMDTPYTLHLAPGATGAFVGRVKAAYEQVLAEVAHACFSTEIFKSDAAKAIIAYVNGAYQDELEFLWDKFPDNAVLRRKDTQKWYAALLTVDKKKLAVKGDGTIEVINVKMPPEDIVRLVDHKRYFPGFHMNKQHWVTLCLDGSVFIDEICQRIDDSYQLATK